MRTPSHTPPQRVLDAPWKRPEPPVGHWGSQSANSQHKIVVSDNKIKFRKRKTKTIPDVISSIFTNDEIKLELGINDLTETTLETLKLKDWLRLLRTKDAHKNAKISDIFRDNENDYEEEAVTDSWFVNNSSNIYLNHF